MSVVSLLTVADVQALMPGLSARAVREELRASGLAVRVRNKLYITSTNFERYLEGKKTRGSNSSNAAGSTTYRGPLPGSA
jgi:hypothetical protein